MQTADHTDSLKIAARMQSCTRTLHQLAPQVGVARQIVEYDSDRRKQILAIEVVPHIKNGESATAAEHLARASEPYANNLAKLAEQYESAQATLSKWEAEKASFEAARSLLSFSKEGLKALAG